MPDIEYMDPDEWDDVDCAGPAEVTKPGYYWRPSSEVRWAGPFETGELARHNADMHVLYNKLDIAMEYIKKRLGK